MNASINSSLQTPLQLGILLVEPDQNLLANRALLLARSNYVVATASSHHIALHLRWMTGIYLAILSDTLGLSGLRSAARAVRAQWPSARILILGAAPFTLEGHLYDEAVDHQFQPKDLLDTLARLSADPWTQRPKRIVSNLETSAHPYEWLTFHRSKAPESDPAKAAGHLHKKKDPGQSFRLT